MKHYLYFSFLLICISTNAQTNDNLLVSRVDSIFSPKLTGETFIERNGYKGEQYFNKNWVKGDILLSTGEMVYGVSLKYNGLLDELIWVNTSFRQFKLDKSFICEFWIKNETGVTSHFKRINIDKLNREQHSDIFAEVRVEGKTSLYIQRKISVVKEENIYQDGLLYLLISISETPLYYIKLPSNHYSVLEKIRRRSFIKLFPEQKKAILKLIRTNHLNLKSEDDLIKTIELMNEKEVF